MESITSWKDLKVLIVDDSKVTRTIIGGMLREIGVRHIFEVDDGEKAVKFKDADFGLVNLVICDWNMPGLSGIELLRYFHDASSGQAFLMVTARCDPKSILEAKEAGVDGYLRKPFSRDELQTKIASILMQKHSSNNQLSLGWKE